MDLEEREKKANKALIGIAIIYGILCVVFYVKYTSFQPTAKRIIDKVLVDQDSINRQLLRNEYLIFLKYSLIYHFVPLMIVANLLVLLFSGKTKIITTGIYLFLGALLNAKASQYAYTGIKDLEVWFEMGYMLTFFLPMIIGAVLIFLLGILDVPLGGSGGGNSGSDDDSME